MSRPRCARGKVKQKLPVVFSKDEVRKIFIQLKGNHLLMSEILYGCGLRLMECLRLRVKDIDFDNDLIIVRSGKGEKDRTTILPEKIKNSLFNHLKNG